MNLTTIAKQLKDLQKAVSHLENITIVKLSKKACFKLLDEVENEELYTVKKDIFDPDRIRKTDTSLDKDSTEYYVGYLGANKPENVTAFIAINYDRPSHGFVYINQLVGVKRGYGFKTLKVFIDKFKSYKVWLIASPKYNKETDTYSENKKLNSEYRKKMTGLKEFSIEANFGPKAKCKVSWFYTPNCNDTIVKMVKDGNYYGI